MCHFTVDSVLSEKLNLLNSVSIGTVCNNKSYKYSKSSLSILSQAHNCFRARLLPCR